MIENKEKACKGTGKAQGFGCGTPTMYRKYGLCSKCFPGWVMKSEPGKVHMNKSLNKVKTKKESISALKKKLDAVFSKYIRLKHSVNERVKCYTCDKEMNWKQIQNGHFHSRSHLSLRWEEKNCRPQCMGCNVMKHGNYIEYYQRLEKEIGSEGLKWLEVKKSAVSKMGVFEYKILIADYESKVAYLESL